MASIPSGPNKKNGMIKIPSPNPKASKGPKDMKKLPIKPPAKAPKGKGPIMRTLPIDDKIYRTMPITEKQLGTIKKMYGI